MKILVVDDERIERRLIEKTLARLGHEIVAAEVGPLHGNISGMSRSAL